MTSTEHTTYTYDESLFPSPDAFSGLDAIIDEYTAIYDPVSSTDSTAEMSGNPFERVIDTSDSVVRDETDTDPHVTEEPTTSNEVVEGLSLNGASLQEFNPISLVSQSRWVEIRNKLKSNAFQLGMIAVAGSTWLFEISPANENLRADVGVDILSRTNNSLLVGLAVGAITMGVETATGVATAKTINQRGGLIGKFNNWLVRKTDTLEDEDTVKKTDFVLGLAGGSTPVVIARHKRAGGRTDKENIKTAINASAGVALFSGALAATAGDIIEWATINGYPEQANSLVTGLENWKTWVGLFALIKTHEQLKGLLSRQKTESPDHKDDTGEIPAETDNEVAERSTVSKLKRYALVSAGVGAIALGVPGELLEMASDNGIVNNVGEAVANNQQLDQAEDIVSGLWDWRIWTTSFASLMIARKANSLISKVRSKPVNQPA